MRILSPDMNKELQKKSRTSIDTVVNIPASQNPSSRSSYKQTMIVILYMTSLIGITIGLSCNIRYHDNKINEYEDVKFNNCVSYTYDNIKYPVCLRNELLCCNNVGNEAINNMNIHKAYSQIPFISIVLLWVMSIVLLPFLIYRFAD